AALLLPDARKVRQFGVRGLLAPAISPDGRLAAEFVIDATRGEAGWRVLDLTDGRQLHRWTKRISLQVSQELQGSAVALHPDGKQVAVANTPYAAKIKLWNLVAGSTVRTLDVPGAPAPGGEGVAGVPKTVPMILSDLHFSPDGRYLAVVSLALARRERRLE